MPEITTDVLTHRAAALVEEIAMATREQWSTHRIDELKMVRAEVLDELHERALAEDIQLHGGGGAPASDRASHGKGCSCCGAGVAQWR